MNKWLLLSVLLLTALLAPASHAQGSAIIGASCSPSGVSSISTGGQPVTCSGQPLVWTVVPSVSGSTSSNLPSGVIDASNPKFGYLTADGTRGAMASFTTTTSNGTKNITTSGADFPFCNGTTVACAAGQPSSVGMLIEVNVGGVGQTNPSSTNVVAVDTIASVTSAHVAVTTTNTANATCAATCFAVWGPDNTAAMAAAWTAATGTAGPCNSFLLPSGLTIVQSNFGSTSTVCRLSQSGPNEAEMTVQGWGYFSSLIVPTTALNLATQCTGQGGAIFFGENGVNYREMGIWGVGFNNTGSHTGCAIMTDGTDNHYERVSITAYGAGDTGAQSGGNTGFIGLHVMNAAGGTNLFDVTVDGGGGVAMVMDTGALHLTIYDCYFADTSGAGGVGYGGIQFWVHTTGTVVDYGSVLQGSNTAGTGIELVDAGATVYHYGTGYNFANNASTNGPQVRGTGYFNGTNFFLTVVAGANGFYSNGGSIYVQNSNIVGGATGNCVFVDTSGKFYNQGGNIWTTCGTKVNLTSGTAKATAAETGVVTCAASTATITFQGVYFANPAVLVSDETTAGGARVSAKSTTTATVTCTGATDVVDFTVAPNPA